MKKSLRGAAVLLIVCMAFTFVLAACGGNSNEETSGAAGSTTAVQTTSTAESVAEQPYAGTEIEVLQFWPTEVGDIITSIADEFTKETGVIVKVTSSPVASHLTDINQRIQSNDLPEIYTMWPGASMPPYIDSKVVADLSNEPWVGAITASSKEACTYNGKVYLAPVNNTFMALAYNVEVFNRLNLQPPKNYADFEAILEKLKADSEIKYPMIFGNDCLPNYAYLMSLSDVYQSIPDFDAQVTAGTKQFNGPEMTEVFKKLLVDWPAKGYYNADTALSTDRMSKAVVEFLDGRAGIMRVGAWDLPVMESLNENKTEYKLFPFPAKDNSGSVLLATGEAFALSELAQGNEKAAAAQFITYLMKGENNAKLCKALNSLSPVSGVQVPLAPAIAVLQDYVNQPTRGWNVWPMTVQNNLGDLGNVLTAKDSDKEKVLTEKLKVLQDAWMTK